MFNNRRWKHFVASRACQETCEHVFWERTRWLHTLPTWQAAKSLIGQVEQLSIVIHRSPLIKTVHQSNRWVRIKILNEAINQPGNQLPGNEANKWNNRIPPQPASDLIDEEIQITGPLLAIKWISLIYKWELTSIKRKTWTGIRVIGCRVID